MKKHWDLFNEISQLTRAGALNWREVDRLAHARQIAKPGRIIRQFETTFSFNGHPATLVCIEKRIYIDEDYLFPFEDITAECLILGNDEVMEKVAEPLVPWYWLKGLAASVANASKRLVIPQQA